jgi:hypothetical protein
MFISLKFFVQGLAFLSCTSASTLIREISLIICPLIFHFLAYKISAVDPDSEFLGGSGSGTGIKESEFI